MLIKVGQINLDCVMVDWFTVTSFDYRFYEFWERVVKDIKDERQTAKLMQYTGNEWKMDTGTLRLLGGKQKDFKHWMVTCSGQLSNSLYSLVRSMVREGIHFKCTRLDLQCTIARPKSYDSVALFNGLSERKRTVKYDSSVDKVHGKVATVGVGNRSSQRYTRIYEKPLSDTMCGLRFETEYKRELADKLVMEEFHTDSVFKDSLLHELLKMGSKWLEAHFYIAIDSNRPLKIKGKMDKESNTKEWLINTVLPTLERVVRNHDDNGEIAHLFARVIDHALREV